MCIAVVVLVVGDVDVIVACVAQFVRWPAVIVAKFGTDPLRETRRSFGDCG